MSKPFYVPKTYYNEDDNDKCMSCEYHRIYTDGYHCCRLIDKKCNKKDKEKNMRVEEIALRQEIRQLLTESGLNKNTIYDMAKEVLQEEIGKQVHNAINQSNINEIASKKIGGYEFRDMVSKAVRQQILDSIDISIDVKVGDKK